MFDVTLPQDAALRLCQAIDDGPFGGYGRTEEVCFGVAMPHRIAFDLPAIASPMAMVEHALLFMGHHRKSIGKIIATLLLRAGEDLEIRTAVLESLLVWRPSQTELHATAYTRNDPVSPTSFVRLMVRNGLLQRLIAEELHLRVGRCAYFIDEVRRTEIAPETEIRQAQAIPARLYTGEGGEDQRLLDRSISSDVFLEDCAMLGKGKTIGLRSTWLRRVAVPLLDAHRNVTKSPNKGAAVLACMSIERCADVPLRKASRLYLMGRFGITEGEIHDQAVFDPLIRS